jgi:hypothetical protein
MKKLIIDNARVEIQVSEDSQVVRTVLVPPEGAALPQVLSRLTSSVPLLIVPEGLIDKARELATCYANPAEHKIQMIRILRTLLCGEPERMFPTCGLGEVKFAVEYVMDELCNSKSAGEAGPW